MIGGPKQQRLASLHLVRVRGLDLYRWILIKVGISFSTIKLPTVMDDSSPASDCRPPKPLDIRFVLNADESHPTIISAVSSPIAQTAAPFPHVYFATACAAQEAQHTVCSPISSRNISTGAVPLVMRDASRSPFTRYHPSDRICTQSGPAGTPLLAAPTPSNEAQIFADSVEESTRMSPHSANPTAPIATTPQSGMSNSLVLHGLPVSNESFGIPGASTGQTSPKIMTISSGQGPVQVPVEIQTATDEKRKRNADASVRFRARRNWREREARSRIEYLESQVEWYRQELMRITQTLLDRDRHLCSTKAPTQTEEDAQQSSAVPQSNLA